MVVKKLCMNRTGLDFVVGDIHGCFTKVMENLEALGFRPKVDRLICVGDLVDRGDESKDVLEFLRQEFVHSVLGNHELMIRSYKSKFLWPTAERISRLGQDWFFDLPGRTQAEIVNAFDQLPLMIEIESMGCPTVVVHAEMPGRSLQYTKEAFERGDPTQTGRMMNVACWGRSRIETMDDSRVSDVKAVIVGHSGVRELTILGNHYYIDTGAWVKGLNHPFLFLDPQTLKPITINTPRPKYEDDDLFGIQDEDIPY